MIPDDLVDAQPLLLSAAMAALAILGSAAVILLLLRAGARRKTRAEARATAMLDALPDPVELRDGDGRLAFANRSAAELRGPGREPDGLRRFDEAVESGTGPRWVAWAETALQLDGRPHRLRGGREITDRLAAERALDEARSRAEAASEAKSRFIASVSHEFRTPLNGILGMTALLDDTPLDAEQRTYVGAVRSSAEAFLSLVEDILDFARIEAGRLELAAEPFEIEALVQGVVELLAPRAQGKGTGIACFVGRDVPRVVIGDADRLRQVLFNLAGNAVKFTISGGVGIAVERGAGDGLVICVEDTGPGIPGERRAEIFEEFDQGGLPEARGSGTGLGLAITRRLVERMGGRISLDSTVGVGSRFRVALDLPAAAEPATAAPSPPAGSLSVLILSGSPFDAAYLARTLGEVGVAALRAGTMEEAVAAMGRRRFDVLVADHALAETDMRAVAREARRRGIGRSIVLLSPFERRDFGSPHAAGFDAYLVKPVRSRSLFEQLATRAAAAQPAASPASPAVPASGPRPARRVLLAEDNEVNALLAMRALQKLGAVVEWARDGREALARAEAAMAEGGLPFDLVLMDIHMPGLDGREVTRRIRRLELERELARPCRIIVSTASLGRDITALEDDPGFDGTLRKPFTLEALAAELWAEEPDSAKPPEPRFQAAG